jgi:hypothetical protein
MLMRSWTVAVGAASLLALTLVTASAAPSAPAVSLPITRTGFHPDEDTGLPAGKTYWFFTYRVAVHSDEPCSRLTLNWRYRILSDGRLEQAGAQDNGSELAPTPSADQTFPIEVGFGPNPGEVVALHAVGRCVTSEGQVLTSAPTSRAVQIPPFSCQRRGRSASKHCVGVRCESSLRSSTALFRSAAVIFFGPRTRTSSAAGRGSCLVHQNVITTESCSRAEAVSIRAPTRATFVAMGLG